MITNQLVIIGGGIAALSCAESYSLLKPNDKVIILSCSPILKTVCNVQKISKVLESFDVFESQFTDIEFQNPNISIVICDANSIDIENKIVKTDKGDFKYDYLSICSGAKPNLIKNSKYLIGIRDTETIIDLKNRLKDSKRIVLVGNGGIALELIHEIKDCQIIWSIKDDHIGNAFFDKDASNFLFKSKQFIQKQPPNKEEKDLDSDQQQLLVAENKNTSTTLSNKSLYKSERGSALGPQWYSKYNFSSGDGGNTKDLVDDKKFNFNENVNIKYETMLIEIYENDGSKETNEIIKQAKCFGDNIDNIDNENWPVYVKLNNGNIFGCNFIISATGVIPNSSILINGLENSKNISLPTTPILNDENAIIVDKEMKTKIDRIYAAGDVCSIECDDRDNDLPKEWFQMRLWSQARTQGRYAAQCIAKQTVLNTPDQDNLNEICTSFEFELFAHATKFFGFKVIMLGLYNAQGFNDNNDNDSSLKIYTREIIGEQYVRVILKNGKLIGALLIGDTDLEETFENLILNKIDLSVYGKDILNPEIDLEDYFD